MINEKLDFFDVTGKSALLAAVSSGCTAKTALPDSRHLVETPEKRAQYLAKMLKALGDTTRLRILELLRNGELCVCEIVPQIEASQSNISQHLRILRDAGIIELEKHGRENHYYVTNQKIFQILDMIGEIILESLKVQIAEMEG